MSTRLKNQNKMISKIGRDLIRASPVEAKIETKGYLGNPRIPFLFIFSEEFEKNNFENFRKFFEIFFKFF
jgi:hypothetical protein